ncbi:MAG TPA: glutathione S-transferase N-terminal domain-containing protein [Conexibacter sp.]|nr:glutathione S-transferase N-terminal domain-containing protein [Conexibacter sp.]
MRARLYGFSISNPSRTAHLMLEYKGIEAKNVELLPGLHPMMLWASGFRRGTVPALKLEGRRIEGSIEIGRALEAAVPDPPLFPRDPELRAAVEAAEAWGESELQMVPRRLARWALARDNGARTRIAAEIGIPLPAVAAALNWPVARAMAARVDADEAHVRQILADLPTTLDRVDGYIADGTLGGEQPNAADFQIAPSIRILVSMADLTPALAGRPCEAHARRFVPKYPDTPPLLPRELLAEAGL